MPIRDVCSPNSSGQKPKPQVLPHPPPASRGVKHAAVYGDGKRRNDQVTELPEQPPISAPASSPE
jgi:hypothetical protein